MCLPLQKIKKYLGFTKEQILEQNRSVELNEKLIAFLKANYSNVISEDHQYTIDENGNSVFLPERDLLSMLDGTYEISLSEEENSDFSTRDITSPFKTSSNSTSVTVEVRSATESNIVWLASFSPIPGTTSVLELVLDQDIKAAVQAASTDMMYLAAGAGLGKILQISKVAYAGNQFSNMNNQLVNSAGYLTQQAATNRGSKYFVSGGSPIGAKHLALAVMRTPSNYQSGDVTVYYDSQGIYKLTYSKTAKLHDGDPALTAWFTVTEAILRTQAERIAKSFETNNFHIASQLYIKNWETYYGLG